MVQAHCLCLHSAHKQPTKEKRGWGKHVRNLPPSTFLPSALSSPGDFQSQLWSSLSGIHLPLSWSRFFFKIICRVSLWPHVNFSSQRSSSRQFHSPTICCAKSPLAGLFSAPSGCCSRPHFSFSKPLSLPSSVTAFQIQGLSLTQLFPKQKPAWCGSLWSVSEPFALLLYSFQMRNPKVCILTKIWMTHWLSVASRCTLCLSLSPSVCDWLWPLPTVTSRCDSRLGHMHTAVSFLLPSFTQVCLSGRNKSRSPHLHICLYSLDLNFRDYPFSLTNISPERHDAAGKSSEIF